jgi:hypothetical protein
MQRRRHAGRAVEVEPPPAAGPGRLLDDEVAVQEHRLDLGEQRGLAVEMGPPRLHHADGGIGELVDGALEDVRGRHEVGVEHRDELPVRPREPLGERARLVPLPRLPVDVVDPVAGLGHPPAAPPRDRGRVVGRVVEHLDLEPLPGIVDRACRLDHPLGHPPLVVHRELDGHRRQVAVAVGRHGAAAPGPRVEEHHPVAVRAVRTDDQDHDEVGGEQEQGEGLHGVRRSLPGLPGPRALA